ncbi:MAG: succinate dehydrogenase cytochrome b subunit [Patulibacter sp.]
MIALYRSDLGRKYVMAVTGALLLTFVFLHMVGNLKLYAGAHELDHYGEWLREIGYPALPHSGFLWLMRFGLVAAVGLHLDAAFKLARKSRAARPVDYAAPREYVAADFASRTVRWTGPIVLLFIIFHLLDLTIGTANPNFVAEHPYENLVASFQRAPVALAYVVANLALAFHLYHGAWSLFQSLGIGGPGTRQRTRYFAIGFATVIALGNISFPLAVVTGLVG